VFTPRPSNAGGELRRLAGDTRPTDRVALYARVSAHDQTENADLNRQLDRLTEYAHDHGWSVENTYPDVGTDLNSPLDDGQEADYGRILVTSFSDKLSGMRSSKTQQLVNTVESEVKPDE
jgi:putative resolvase